MTTTTTITPVQQDIIDQVKIGLGNPYAWNILRITMCLIKGNAVQFHSARLRRNVVIAYSEGTDLYTVTTVNLRNYVTKTAEGVYNDMLPLYFAI